MDDRRLKEQSRFRSTFDLFLRTGLRFRHNAGDDVEAKFNPWHDPEDGRFTFVGQGRRFASATESPSTLGNSAARRPRATATQSETGFRASEKTKGGGGSTGGAGATGHGYWLNPTETAELRRKYPGMQPTMAQPGDNWDSVAKRTKTSRHTLLKTNPTLASRELHAGDLVLFPITVSNSDAFASGSSATGGSANHGTGIQKIRLGGHTADTTSRHVKANGYDYTIDKQGRTIRATGTLPSIRIGGERDRRAQAAAGGTDRLKTDEGGHYVARRFDGPKEAYNHFAQDRNFNRSAYAKLENSLDQARRTGKKVSIDIMAIYAG